MGPVIVSLPTTIKQVPYGGFLIGYVKGKGNAITKPLIATTTLAEAVTAFVQLMDSKDEQGQLVVTPEKRKLIRFLQRKGDRLVSVMSPNGTLKI
jgi:hypothetical protein